MTSAYRKVLHIPSDQYPTVNENLQTSVISTTLSSTYLCAQFQIPSLLFAFIISLPLSRQRQSSVPSLIWSEEIVFILIIKNQFQRLPADLLPGCCVSSQCTDVCLLHSLHSAQIQPIKLCQSPRQKGTHSHTHTHTLTHMLLAQTHAPDLYMSNLAMQHLVYLK